MTNSLLLCRFRGGEVGRKTEQNDNNNNYSIFNSNISGKKNQSSSLQQIWNIGKKSWTFAVERITPSWQTLEFTVNGDDDDDDDDANNSRGNMAADAVTTAKEQYDEDNTEVMTTSSSKSFSSTRSKRPSYYSPFRMYLSCMGIVSLWILTGTLFYSYYNEWPIPQSFFYAVDAGMSIGFCTDVAETKLVSKAFTVIYILLGASVVGGALALFIQDIVEGVVDRETRPTTSNYIKEYNLTLEKEVFRKFDVSKTGTLSKDEFRNLLESTIKTTTPLSEDDINILWTKFDRIKDGAIHFEEFSGTFRGIEGLIASLHNTTTTTTSITTPKNDDDDDDSTNSTKWLPTTTGMIKTKILFIQNSIYSTIRSIWKSENRIYGVFIAWVLLGIAWGMIDQGWDSITSTHFAISALATGGLTAPQVNNDGILPARSSIFCGCYCLFGIPLMAITFGNFARVLVSDHVSAMEEWALTRPMTATEYKIAKKYLTKTSMQQQPPQPPQLINKIKEEAKHSSKSTKKGRLQILSPASVASASDAWRGLRLSDFIVLQLLRQGRISGETMNILKKEFEVLDKDKTGVLTLEEATNWSLLQEDRDTNM